MKKYIKLCMLLSLAVACNNEDKGLVDGIGDNACNAVYMGNSNSAGVVAVLASDTDGASFSITPRLAAKHTDPIEVTLEVDLETLNDYNQKNRLSVRPIDPKDVFFADVNGNESVGKITTVIKPGDINSLVTGRIKNLDPEKYPYDGRYAIPVKITDVRGGLDLLPSPVYTITNLNRKIKTSVFHLKTVNNNDYTQRFMPKTPYTEELEEWTMQYIAQFNDLTKNNQTTASLSGKGFYNRISTNLGLQIKSEGRDGEDTWTGKPVKSGEWLHVSYVYRKSGLVGRLAVYVNGELQKEFTTSLLYLDNQPRSGWGFGNENLPDFYLREIRFWSRALTPAEIQDKYYLPEDPKAEGLEAYFPMTRESYDEANQTFLDLTGKWKWEIRPNTTWEFVDNVVFPAKSLKIEP